MTDQPTGAGRGPQPPVDHTQEIPSPATQEIPRPAGDAHQAGYQQPAWQQGTPQGAPQQPGWQQPAAQPAATRPADRKRPGWLVPAGLGAAALLVVGGTAVGLHNGDDTAPAGLAATSAATDSVGTNTQAPVAQGNATAPDWVATAAAASPSVVSIDVASGTAQGQGSGVIIDKEGRIVTNNHVAAGAGTRARIAVTLSDQRAYAATVVGTDPSTDLAVIKITNPPADLKPIAFGDSDALKVGQPVMAVGNPLGLSGTVTTGIVSALNRPVTTSASEAQQPQDPWGGQQGTTTEATDVFTNAIQTSAAINPGNSGGALVDAGGRLIGINSSIASLGSGGGQSGNIGIGFAIPVNEVKNITKQLIATGRAEHAYLGVSATTGIAKDGSGQREAAIVREVMPETGAAKAGLKAGDAIIALDGLPITGQTSLISQVYAKSVGDTATVDYIRNGQRAQTKITFGKRPTQP